MSLSSFYVFKTIRKNKKLDKKVSAFKSQNLNNKVIEKIICYKINLLL